MGLARECRNAIPVGQIGVTGHWLNFLSWMGADRKGSSLKEEELFVTRGGNRTVNYTAIR
jgi:hypothetical protein